MPVWFCNSELLEHRQVFAPNGVESLLLSPTSTLDHAPSWVFTDTPLIAPRLISRYCHCPHCTEAETEALRGLVTCGSSHSQSMVEMGHKSSWLALSTRTSILRAGGQAPHAVSTYPGLILWAVQHEIICCHLSSPKMSNFVGRKKSNW